MLLAEINEILNKQEFYQTCRSGNSKYATYSNNTILLIIRISEDGHATVLPSVNITPSMHIEYNEMSFSLFFKDGEPTAAWDYMIKRVTRGAKLLKPLQDEWIAHSLKNR